MLYRRRTWTRSKAEEIQEGAIGKVPSFGTKFGHSGPENRTGTDDTWFFKKTSAGMGALADLGIHKTDLSDVMMTVNTV